MLRLLLVTAFALLVAAAVALAAPGIGSGPYVPAPVEFDLAAPVTPPRAAAAGRGFVAPPVRAAKRFNLVGLSWRGRSEPAIAVRSRRDGGAWSRWVPASGHGEHAPEPRASAEGRRAASGRATSEPIWVGEADWVQYRLSHRVPGVRLHFVNTTGTATAKDRAISRLRSIASAAVTRVASAWAARGPRIRTRAEWGAKHCRPRAVAYGSVRAAVVHHTVTANDYSRAQTPAAILAICRFHRNTNGWSDIGYNFVVDRFGRIWEGRAGGTDEPVMGAHAQGYNAQTTGISNLGTFSSRPQSDAAVTAMARLVRWKLGVHGVRTHGRALLTSSGGSSARYPAGSRRRFNRISGHRDTGRTACPGTQLYRQLPELRERVGERRPPGRRVRVDAPLPEEVTYSRRGIAFSGQILDADWLPLAGAELELQRLGRLGWRTIARATSDQQGAFTAVRRIGRRPVLRWKFAGDDANRPYRGDGTMVSVAPAISLRGSARTIAPGETVRLTGSIAPRTRTRPRLLIEREQDGVWRRSGGAWLKSKTGRIARNWRPRQGAGNYRASVVFGGDGGNAPATSPYVEVTVVDPLTGF